jgi:hypothetical protein
MPDIQTICWYVSYALGMILFLGGIFYLLRKKHPREEDFIKATLFEFCAAWILYLPEEIFNDVPESLPSLKMAESIFTAFLRTFNIYLGNDYSRIEFAGHPVFSSLYATLITVVNIVMLFFVAGLIVKFLEGPVQLMRMSLSKRRPAYVFPVCNSKTLAIAESIKDPRTNIIFAYGDREPGQTEKQRINDIGGVYVSGSVAGILDRIGRRSKGIEIFLFGDSEVSNLSELEKICDKVGAGVKAPVRIFVELSDTPWDLYDSFLDKHNTPAGEKLIINFVRTEESFAYNDLLKYSIFENAIQTDEKWKDIKVLIVGMNERNLEMLKAVLHLGQMPGYRLTVMVLDESDGRKRLMAKLPEVYDECKTEGDAIYRLIYKENVDMEVLEAVGNEYPDFTFAFVNAGNDLKNTGIAVRLNEMCLRKGRKAGYRIQVNIEDQKICRSWDSDITERMDFVGDIKTIYAHDFITMSDIEKGAIAIHEVRYPEGTDRYRSWVSYCNNEYNRHSVYARTLSFKHKVKIIHDMYDPGDELKGTEKEFDIYRVTKTNRIWKIYEHMRWNMYTRTRGFVLADKALLDEDGRVDKKTRSAARVHHDLIHYSKLPKEDQDKDALELTPEIVKILRDI